MSNGVKNYTNRELGLLLEGVRDKIDEVKKTLENNYVTKAEFDPVKRIAYRLVAALFTLAVGIGGAIIAFFINR